MNRESSERTEPRSGGTGGRNDLPKVGQGLTDEDAGVRTDHKPKVRSSDGPVIDDGSKTGRSA